MAFKFKKKLTCIAVSVLATVSMGYASLNDTYKSIYSKIDNLQVKKNQAFSIPQQHNGLVTIDMIKWEKQAGLFESWIHINTHGGKAQTIFRDQFQIFDNNFFVTAWVLDLLMQAEDFGAIHINPILFHAAITAETKFLDKNKTDTALVNFWAQKLQKDGKWASYPSNLISPVQKTVNLFDLIHNTMIAWGQEKLWDKIKIIAKEFTNMLDAFRIPPDADDSALNLALGAAMFSHLDQKQYQVSFKTWQATSNETKIKNLLKSLVKYAYRPAAANQDANTIDTRTYLTMHEFLTETQNTNPSIISTWLLNISDEKSQLKPGEKEHVPNVAMPFNVNNVDASVVANTLYGISKLEKSGMIKDFSIDSDADLSKLLIDSANYLAWVINKHKVLERPDIAILYYPSAYDFYWFVSRTLALHQDRQEKTSQAATQVYETLTKAMKTTGTEDLIKLAQKDKSYAYWDDFLGDADQSVRGNKQAEDRIFSTAVAVNTLINTWTTIQGVIGQKTLTWDANTPNQVKILVKGGIAFIKDNILYDNLFYGYRKDNAFFSGSMKGFENLPYLYPANAFETLRGKTFKPEDNLKNIKSTMIVSFRGQVSENKYNTMLKEKHFGYDTPKFMGFNGENSVFPYWSAPALTYAVSLTALAKFEAIK